MRSSPCAGAPRAAHGASRRAPAVLPGVVAPRGALRCCPTRRHRPRRDEARARLWGGELELGCAESVRAVEKSVLQSARAAEHACCRGRVLQGAQAEGASGESEQGCARCPSPPVARSVNASAWFRYSSADTSREEVPAFSSARSDQRGTSESGRPSLWAM